MLASAAAATLIAGTAGLAQPRPGGSPASPAAGAALGAQGGGANSGGPPPPLAQPTPQALYQDGYSYPAYGEPHYGDPRYDPRYGPQGWGYGHRPGEWVGIRERGYWLNRRIDRAVDAGYMGRREAHDLQRDILGLEGLEYRYIQQGMAPWMRADLDRRFDFMAQRVKDVPAPPPPPPRYYGHERDNYYGR
jgi:hypothetical protein